MFGRKRNQIGSPAPSPQTAALRMDALQTVYTKVLQAFVADSVPAPAPPAQPGPGTGPNVPPPVNAPGAVFVGSLSAGEGSLPITGAGSGPVNLPGVGNVTPAQIQSAQERAQAAIAEALGSADLMHLTPADAQAVQSRLDAMATSGRLTAGQHAALTDGLAQLSQLSGG